MNLNHTNVQNKQARPSFCPKLMGPPKRPPVRATTSSNISSTTKWGSKSAATLLGSSFHTDTVSYSEGDTRIIIAITEGRGDARCEIGIASIDTSHPVLVVCQMSDVESYINTLTKINILNPTEIIVPLTFVEAPRNRLIEAIKHQFPTLKIIGAPRKSFNKTNGMERILQFCLPSLSTIAVGLQHKYYGLAAASALFTHLENNLYIFYANQTLNVSYEESEGYAIIDVSTADRLELVSSTTPNQSSHYSSLLCILNHCYTKLGSRAMRSIILQPPFHQNLIKRNQECVTELIKCPQKLGQIQVMLQKIANVDQLLTITNITFGSGDTWSVKQLNYILLLKNFIETIEPLKGLLEGCRELFFRELHDLFCLGHFEEIRKQIGEWIHPSAFFARGAVGVQERCFAIKSGINGLLDLVRKSYSERLEEMRVYVSQLATKYNLPLTLGNNTTKGYHIIFKLNHTQKRTMKKSDIPSEFIQVYRLAGSFTMKTPELINFSTRVEDLMLEILKISNVMINKLICEFKQHIGFFYKLCENIGKLDMFQSLAEVSASNKYIKPKIGTFTEVAESAHPMLNFILEADLVTNPISICKDFNVQIITGPNGSGKSIYIRQIILLHVMAQIGCYIPAKSAIIRPMERMFARIYLEDNIEYGASAFMIELNEFEYMLTLPPENCLFIIDEPCRSTYIDEGSELAMAIIEKLCLNKSFVYVTTHYTKITQLADLYLSVKVCQMETTSTGDDPRSLSLTYRYHLLPNVTQLKNYGILLIKHIWPEEVCNQVYEFLHQLEHNESCDEIDTRPHSNEIRLKYKLESDIRKFKSRKRLTETALHRLFHEYSEELKKFNWQILDESINSSGVNHVEQVSIFLNESASNLEKLIPEVAIIGESQQAEVVENWEQLPCNEDEILSVVEEVEASQNALINKEENSVFEKGTREPSWDEDEVMSVVEEVEASQNFTFTQLSSQDTFKTANNESNIQQNYLTPIVNIIEGPNSTTPKSVVLSLMSEEKTTDESNTIKPITKNKFGTTTTTTTTSSSWRRITKPKRFIPPRRLTRKDIELDFLEQDKKMYESNNQEELQRHITKMLSRPNFRQIQKRKHLVMGRRTTCEQVDVIQLNQEKVASKTLSRMPSTSDNDPPVDMSLFSDQGADCFKQIMKSDRSVFGTFAFNQPSCSKIDEAKLVFEENTNWNALITSVRTSNNSKSGTFFQMGTNSLYDSESCGVGGKSAFENGSDFNDDYLNI